MALQHLYTRVPARMSMFNRVDGYDTFACSAQVTQDYVKRELANVDEIRLASQEHALIYDNILPPTYVQYTGRDGRLIQSVLRFMPRDYSGESSAYFVHSLILNKDEQEMILKEPVKALFSRDQFEKDLVKFRFDNIYSTFDHDLPEIDRQLGTPVELQKFVEKYDPEMVKRTILAIYSALCNKGKSLCIVLPVELSDLSDEALDFMNAIMMIVPYVLRPQLSFATYTGDFGRYPLMKIRFSVAAPTGMNTNKYVVLDFGAKSFLGIDERIYTSRQTFLDFFYGMLTNESIRREFLDFADRIDVRTPLLKNMSMKAISDLVFLFMGASGHYSEKICLPGDDSVQEYYNVYERFSDGLTSEYRAKAMVPLHRYPDKHIAIPKPIFQKITKLYPKEDDGAKAVIMDTFLDLIHFEAMRDKLFQFIKRNFPDETNARKDAIVGHLTRVYYGGFLQPQLINFFAEIYDDMSPANQQQVLEKLCLTIRTPAVQNAILKFLDGKYDVMTEEEKTFFYRTVEEELPECDRLTEKLINFVNQKILDETESRKKEMVSSITALLELEQEKKNSRLLNLLNTCGGFCQDVILEKLFREWNGNAIFDEYVKGLRKLPFEKKLASIRRVSRVNLNGASAEMAKDLAIEKPEINDLFRLLEAETSLKELTAIQVNPANVRFITSIREDWLLPAITALFPQVLSVSAPENAKELVEAYAGEHPVVKNSGEYRLLQDYEKLLSDAANEDYEKAAKEAAAFDSSYRNALAKKLQVDAKTVENGDLKLFLHALSDQLTIGMVHFRSAYQKAFHEEEATLAEEEERLMKTFRIASQLMKAFPTTGMNPLASDNGEWRFLLSAYVLKHGSKAKRDLVTKIKNTDLVPELKTYLENSLNETSGQKKRLFLRIFNR